jgi:hypothetical protein
MRNLASSILLISLIGFGISFQKANYIYQTGESEIYRIDSASVSKWSFTKEAYAESEVHRARKLSADSIGIFEDDAAEVKMNKIASFLILKFYKQLGSPSEELRTLTPWRQYEALREDTTQDLYCTHFSAMYSFFCRVNGLSIREIECKGVNDLHIFNEVFSPEEKKWVYSDLTHGIVRMNKDRQCVSTLEMYASLQNTTSSLTIESPLHQAQNVSFASAPIRQALQYNFDANCAFYFYQTAELNIIPQPLYKKQDPVALVYSNRCMYWKWPLAKILCSFLALISTALLLRRKLLPSK